MIQQLYSVRFETEGVDLFVELDVVSHQVGQQSSSTSRCWGERQPRAECFLSRL